MEMYLQLRMFKPKLMNFLSSMKAKFTILPLKFITSSIGTIYFPIMIALMIKLISVQFNEKHFPVLTKNLTCLSMETSCRWK